MGAELLSRSLERIERGELPRTPQDGARATLAPVLEKEHGRLDFRLSASRLACRIRGLTPWPGAFTTLGGKLLKVHAAREATSAERAAATINRTAESLVPHMENRVPDTAKSTENLVPDTAKSAVRGVMAAGSAVPIPGGILVACADGSALLITVLQLEGKRRLTAAEFLKGLPLPAGTVLGA